MHPCDFNGYGMTVYQSMFFLMVRAWENIDMLGKYRSATVSDSILVHDVCNVTNALTLCSRACALRVGASPSLIASFRIVVVM